MTLNSFRDNIGQRTDLQIRWEGDKSYVITYTYPDGTRTSQMILKSSVESVDWDQLLSVLIRLRKPDIMSHVSRIVGYWSLHSAWNASKLAELRDRHKGNYILSDRVPHVESHAWPREVVDEQLVGHAENAVCEIKKPVA